MSVDTNSYYFKMAVKAQELTHEKDIITQGEGGSIPILAEFQTLFNKPIILIGLNSPNDNIHAPNERFKRDDYHDGIRTYIHYLHLIGNGITN